MLYPYGTTPACQFAARELKKAGIPIIDHPSPEVTHLLLDVPSTLSPKVIADLLRILPEQITIFGGRIPVETGAPAMLFDLLKDEQYLVKNAAITAECALQVLLENIPHTIFNSRILLLGWGRISKVLSRLLRSLSADVSVCSRNPLHLAEVETLDCQPIPIFEMENALAKTDVVINTAPSVMIPEAAARKTQAVKIDLASCPGIEGADVIRANGLPGKLAPVSSGKLIAQTVLRYMEGEK